MRLPLIWLMSAAVLAGADPAPRVTAVRTAQPPTLDGRIDEAAWAEAPAVTSFTQRDPQDGRPGSKSTAVRMLYDNDALYVGARIEGQGSITFRLGRRDMVMAPSDWFRLSLDTFRDRRSAVRFDVNPGGVQRDAIITGDYFQETGLGREAVGGYRFAGDEGEVGWDAVWDAATSVDAQGWTAEIRIPFSQLRFADRGQDVGPKGQDIGEAIPYPPARSPDRAWGVQFEVIDAQRQELSMFAYRSKREPGGVQAFGYLDGLSNLQARKPIELIPYVLGQAAFDSTSSNPLKRAEEYDLKGGLDLRYRVTSNLTLTAALNPDFGQVEVDPAVINLTAFETRFEEKRPFFLEGVNLFALAPSLRSRNAARELLYPRRIGRVPQIGLPAGVSEVPAATDIIAAAKLTGRTESGWAVGLLDAYTAGEHGFYLDETGTHRAIVEPPTNYLAGRVIREVRNGQTAVGVIATAVNRSLGDPRAAAALAKSAYTGAVDWGTDFLGRVWNVSGYLAASRLQGTPAAMTVLQRASSRYYQRPDARSFHLDPGATSLQGASGQVQLSKQTGAHWTGNAEYAFISPGYEINDMGFQQRVDRRGLSGRLTWSERTPGKFFRRIDLTLNPTLYQNFDGDWLDRNLRVRTNFRHLSYWGLDFEADFLGDRMDDRLTRGGPMARQPGSRSLLVMLTSDRRKTIRFGVDLSARREDSGSRTAGIAANWDIQAAKRWNLSLGPSLTSIRQHAQYVGTVADARATGTYGRRYIFSPLEQREAGVSARLNYAFSAKLTLEAFAQALVANGDYGPPKEFLQPRGYRFATYGSEIGTVAKSGTTYTIDPDGAGPAAAFTLRDRTFTNRSLRVNAVLRWEYRPGSTLYAVWQQDRTGDAALADFSFGRAAATVFDIPARNVFALKASYWFNP